MDDSFVIVWLQCGVKEREREKSIQFISNSLFSPLGKKAEKTRSQSNQFENFKILSSVAATINVSKITTGEPIADPS